MQVRVTVSKLGLLAALTVPLACGEERAPFIDDAAPKPSGGGATVGSAGESSAGEPSVPSGGTDTKGFVDDSEVYFVGTLALGDLEREALTAAEDGNTFFVGWNGLTETIALSQGNVLYELGGKLRRFVPETKSMNVDVVIPDRPEQNDPVLDTPPCTDAASGVSHFLTGPESRLIYRCEGDTVWYENGVEFYDAAKRELGEPTALGYEGVLLTSTREFGLALVTSEAHAIVEGVPLNAMLLKARAAPDGFHLAISPDEEATSAQLWFTDLAGSAMLLEEYPAPPEGVGVYSGVLNGALDLYQGAVRDTPGGPQDVIVKRPIGGESTIVYDEAQRPAVKFNLSPIFSGP